MDGRVAWAVVVSVLSSAAMLSETAGLSSFSLVRAAHRARRPDLGGGAESSASQRHQENHADQYPKTYQTLLLPRSCFVEVFYGLDGSNGFFRFPSSKKWGAEDQFRQYQFSFRPYRVIELQ